tara:strand:- start:9416 stop:9649 length:234 start_codon:yes stop_codon:yes gene_type:complete
MEKHTIMKYGPYVIENSEPKFKKEPIIEKFNNSLRSLDDLEIEIEHINTQKVYRNNKELYAHTIKIIFLEEILFDNI